MIMPPPPYSKPEGNPATASPLPLGEMVRVRGLSPHHRQRRPQLRLDRRTQSTLQRPPFAGRLDADRIAVEVRAAPRGPAGGVHRGAPLRPLHDPDQPLLAGFLATAHAGPDGLMARLVQAKPHPNRSA